jgi:CHAD domain-containing protein
MSRTEEPRAHSPEAVPAALPYIVPLRAAMDADTALRAIHRELQRRILANQDGVRQGRGGEFLHDFRVAVRRTRTGLSQLKRVYPRPEAMRFAADFKWVSTATGTARDLEVYLAAFEYFRDALGDEAVDALEPVVVFLRHHQSIEQSDCTEVVESQRYAALMRDWSDFLQQPQTTTEEESNAPRPVADVAAQRIDAAYRRVVRRGDGLREDSPAAAFHRVRLDCKKLRYLLEFFGTLFKGEESARTIVALRRTQDSLGAINDLRVQAAWLRRLPEPPGRAASILAAYLQGRQQQERAAFLGRFATFISEDNAAPLRRSLGVE